MTEGLDAAFLPGSLAERSVKRALNAWQQGDLVRGVGMFWAGTVEVDPLTGLAAAPGPGQPWPVVPWDGVPAEGAETVGDDIAPADWSTSWSVITSQTCDVVATGPGQRHPTVQVSPVIPLNHLDNSKITEIRRGERVDLVVVPGLPEAGTWAADLRISLPVSKAVLLYQEPLRGFLDPTDSVEFAERVAAKFRRPALHDEITGGLVPKLRELVADARKNGQLWPDMIEQFRLQITEGDRLNPRNVRVLAITLEDMAAEDRVALRRWQQRERRRLLKASDRIVLAPVLFSPLEKIGVTVYRESPHLRIPELGQRGFW